MLVATNNNKAYRRRNRRKKDVVVVKVNFACVRVFFLLSDSYVLDSDVKPLNSYRAFSICALVTNRTGMDWS